MSYIKNIAQALHKNITQMPTPRFLHHYIHLAALVTLQVKILNTKQAEFVKYDALHWNKYINRIN